MDQMKIGRFIAERRKNKGYTQMQLAEKLDITDRAVSKWENGKAMPDTAIMLDLCGALGITVNDLLCGEVVSMENYNKELEKNLLEIAKQKEEADKRLLTFEWVISILSLIILLVPCFVGAYLPVDAVEDWVRTVIVLSGFIPGIIGLCFAMRIEQVAGYYECGHCHHKHVPKYMETFMAMHVGRTRYMKCPKCHKRSWQKKVVSKD